MDRYLLKMNGGLLIQVCQNQVFHIQLDHEFVYPKAFEINHVVMLKFKDDLNAMLPRLQASNSIGIVTCNCFVLLYFSLNLDCFACYVLISHYDGHLSLLFWH